MQKTYSVNVVILKEIRDTIEHISPNTTSGIKRGRKNLKTEHEYLRINDLKKKLRFR